MKKTFYGLRDFTYMVTLLCCLGILILMCSCTSNKASSVGTAAGKAAIGSVPNSAAGVINGATTTAISGGRVLQGARNGAAGGIGSAAGAVAGEALRELLK
jgi:hypothetical protein